MLRNRLLTAGLTLLLMMAFTPAIYAQGDLQVDPQQLLGLLGPRSGQDLIFDILLYVIFALGFVTMILVPDKQVMPSLIMIAVLALTLVAKLDYLTLLEPTNIGVLAINVGIFVLPLVVAGMVRSRKGTPRAMWPAVITGLFGGGYFFIFWALAQRNA
jgi:hypothetical protein